MSKRKVVENEALDVKRARESSQNSEELDIKLTDILGIEHAVTNLQKSVKKIIEDAPDFDSLIKTIGGSGQVEDTVRKEIFLALTRTNNVKVASNLRKLYKLGKLAIFDEILRTDQDDTVEFQDSSIDLRISGYDSGSKEADKVEYNSKPYPPPLPPIKNPVILSRVFMHKSVVNDKTYLTDHQILHSHNERLEFLGDSILNNLITLIIFEMFPNFNEGELSRLRIELVNNQTLTNWSRLYEFDKALRKNINDDSFNAGKMKVYADVFEAYIGGLVIDNVSMKEIRAWLQELSEPVLNDFRARQTNSQIKPLNKSAKLELYSLIGCAAMAPRYEVVQIGDGTVLPFIVSCMIKDEELGRASGQNIKEAGLKLAMIALDKKELIEKYSLIRRSMPRSISVLRQDDKREEEETLDSPALPILAPAIPEIMIDNTSKGKLYALLSKHNLKPEYDQEKLADGKIKITLNIKNVPFVSYSYKSGKLAGQRCAQFLLENRSLLKNHGIDISE